MTKNILKYLLAVLVLYTFASCKKGYLTDGGVSNPNVNMTTYDFLKSDTLFADLVHLIDRAGLKDSVNAECTFFAVTNYSIAAYLKLMKQQYSDSVHDENISYTLDSIPLFRLDSLKTYIFHGKINRDDLTLKGKYYVSEFGTEVNAQRRLGLARTYAYSAYVDYVDYVQYSQVIGQLDADYPSTDDIPKNEVDNTDLVQTSGIVTTNGIVHVLNGYHALFFNKTQPHS